MCDRIFSVEESDPVISVSDHVISILPGYASNRSVLGRRFFNLMKPSAYFHNVGRGTCVDEEALLEAVRQKRIAGAYLDVFQEEPLPSDSPLWSTEGIHISPHVSASDESYLDLFLDELAIYVSQFR
jgi:phosphoglycerate dehydrogenase-like enzyme